MLERWRQSVRPRTPLPSDLWPLAARIVLLASAIVFAIWLLTTLTQVLLLLLFAATLAAGITPVIDWLQRRGLRRGLAVVLIYAGLVGGVVLLGLVLVPLALGGIREVIQRAPEYADRLTRWLTELQQSYPPIAGLIDPNQLPLRDAATTLSQQSGMVVTQAIRLGGLALGLVEVVVVVIVLLVVTFYLLIDGRRIRDYVLSFVPAARRPRARFLTDQIGRRMGGWVLGQLALSAVVGLSTLIGLTLLGIPGAPLLAFVAAVGEVVPVAGPILSAVPAVIVAATQSPFQMAAVALLYLGIQQLENHLLVPNVMGRAVNLHPLAVMLALGIGSTLLGVMGALAAVPVAAGVAVVLDELRDRREPAPPAPATDD